MPRGSKPGERRGGRKKGTPNKRTAEVKAALQAAFDQIGGVKALTAWGKDNQTEFYRLWGKLLPVEMKTPEGSALLLKVIDLSGESDADENTPAKA